MFRDVKGKYLYYICCVIIKILIIDLATMLNVIFMVSKLGSKKKFTYIFANRY